MAPTNRRPAKQKRQRQNRQVREARAARSAHAGEATAISAGEREPMSRPRAGTATSGNGGAKGPSTGRRRFLAEYTIPGQRAVVMAFLFTLVSAGTLLFSPIQVERDVSPDDPRIEDESPDRNEDGTVTIKVDSKLLEEEGAALGGAIMVIPIAICAGAVAFTKRPQRLTAWTAAMLALSAFIFLFAGPYGIISLPSLIALAVGGFQGRRVENRERLSELRARKQGRADRTVIEGTATESTVVDETVEGTVVDAAATPNRASTEAGDDEDA